MAKALVVNKQVSLSLIDIIKFQLNMHCFTNKIRLSPAQLDCLSLLGLYGDINMPHIVSGQTEADWMPHIPTPSTIPILIYP